MFNILSSIVDILFTMLLRIERNDMSVSEMSKMKKNFRRKIDKL
jgi:hypothetical protein